MLRDEFDQLHHADGARPAAPTRVRAELDDKGKLRLPPSPSPEDVAGQCAYLTDAFNLDPLHPITGGAHQGLRGANGHVVLYRADAPALRFEPASHINQPQRLIEALNWQMLPSDGAIHALKGDHCRAISHVVRMLCRSSEAITAAQEASGIVGTFLQGALCVEGHTVYGTPGQRYEAALALRRELDERTGRMTGMVRYLIDSESDELVIGVSELGDAARRHVGGSLPRGWLDARMENIGWMRRTLEGRAEPGRTGRRGPHARIHTYRGVLAGIEGDHEAVTT
jgi:hypothetical protein